MNRGSLLPRRRVLRDGLVAGAGLLALGGCAVAPSARTPLAPIATADLVTFAHGIRHAETPVGLRDGSVYASNADSPCAIIGSDGTLRQFGSAVAPNGIALDAHNRLVIANFGLGRDRAGPLQRLDMASGKVETLVSELDGRELIASNFPVVCRDGSIYCTHTSWGPGIDACIDPTRRDGFVYRVDARGRAHIACSGLTTPNGCCLDAGERYLYVAQTAAGRIVRLKRAADGSLGAPEPWGPVLGRTPPGLRVAEVLETFTPGARARLGHPDGLGFDAEGNLWVTLVFANRIVVITPEQQLLTVIDDAEGRVIAMPTGIAWGGPGLRDLYIATAAKPHIVRARAPVPGQPLVHQRRRG